MKKIVFGGLCMLASVIGLTGVFNSLIIAYGGASIRLSPALFDLLIPVIVLTSIGIFGFLLGLLGLLDRK